MTAHRATGAYAFSLFALLLLGPGARPLAAQPPVPGPPGQPARILIMGDSISLGYTQALPKYLQGIATLSHNPGNAGHTATGLKMAEQWLGPAPAWDLVYFNFGLHDMKLKEGGNQVPLEQYRRNLRRIVSLLQATDAILVFATTTPIPEGTPKWRPGDEVYYNDAAREIMRSEGVLLDDLYALVLPTGGGLQAQRDVHFNAYGYDFLARHIAQTITNALAGTRNPE